VLEGKAPKAVVEEEQKVSAADQLNREQVDEYNVIFELELHSFLLNVFIRHNWKLAQVVNSHPVCDPTIRQPGFDLPRQRWSLLNRCRMDQGHCGACRRKWRLTDTDLCPCGETRTMSHIVESCPLTKLNGGLSRLHSADKYAVSWLTSYG